MSIFSNISHYFSTAARERHISKIYNDVENIINRQLLEVRDKNNAISKTGIMGLFSKIKGRRPSADENLANDWNFTDMFETYKVEGYLKYSVDTYIESALKGGFTFASKNPSVVNYLNMRHKQMAYISGSPTYDLFRKMLFSLVLYGNTILHKYRSVNQSPGNSYVDIYGVTRKPIAVLDVEDPRYTKITKNKSKIFYNFSASNTQLNAQIFSHYQQYKAFFLDANKQNIPVTADDILHMRFHPQLKEKWAIPPFNPAVSDIEAVRLIEENIELLVFQYGHPFLHVKVGSDKHQATPEEINDVVIKINSMESNGFLATENNVAISAVDTSKSASNIEKYLTYFKYRLYTELWLSPITTGEGGSANRATASTIDKLKQNKTIELQSILADYYQSILIEMLLEGGAPLEWILTKENIPTLKFPAVALDDKVMFENNIINQYNSGLVTNAEARAELGRDPLTKSESMDLRESRLVEANIAATSTNTENKAASNATQPENQYGKKAGPTQAQNA